ncbi:hypothetical protein VT84_34780 [Gemmata sp. SH-PL17]|uniref:hypothetical protein n=1 Tax=Gemmata sp. SH-PL17 TaxID=1630693 RepID=UPI0004B3598D|nr:hypothetical protein [Gemmata sp. SH-PL17]AMV29612.1 hypothetical protein VT84_34780 [Gemmata sp. SH-PL17]
MLNFHSGRSRATGLCLAFLAGLGVLGCGSKTPTGEVYGTVTYKNAPVSAGTVKFIPEKGEPVSADLGPDGTYRATGVPAGKAKIAIETIRFKNLTPPPAGMAKMMGGPKMHYVPIPDKYEKAETTDLSVDVIDGKKEWKITLE